MQLAILLEYGPVFSFFGALLGASTGSYLTHVFTFRLERLRTLKSLLAQLWATWMLLDESDEFEAPVEAKRLHVESVKRMGELLPQIIAWAPDWQKSGVMKSWSNYKSEIDGTEYADLSNTTGHYLFFTGLDKRPPAKKAALNRATIFIAQLESVLIGDSMWMKLLPR
jgi:hypothetical protein